MEKGQAAQEGLEDAIRSCRKKGREEKAQFELNLANSVRGNKECLYKYINEGRGKSPFFIGHREEYIHQRQGNG